MTSPNRLDRRSYLRVTSAAGIALTAGCASLDPRDQRPDGVVLDRPEWYDEIDGYEDADLSYPTYGDELPEATAPDPLRERDVTTTEFVGERHSLFTFVFTRCHGACPALMASLRQVQADAIDEGYEDEIALATVTFDPEYDTPEVLEEYGEDMGVNFAVGNWYFLRPETPEAAHEVVEEGFGCFFEENEDYDGHGGHDDHDHDDHHDDHDEDHDHSEMAFQHLSLIVLANADGYVERAYTDHTLPSPNELVDDVRELRERW